MTVRREAWCTDPVSLFVRPPDLVYSLIGVGFEELQSGCEMDTGRPLVEFYKRTDEIELLVPVLR
jgi:hypothetical protein